MSQEEQDQIFGKLARKHRCTQQTIGALEAKVTEAGYCLRQAGDALIELGRRDIQLDAEFLRYPDKQELRDTVEELRAERVNREQQAAQLDKIR